MRRPAIATGAAHAAASDFLPRAAPGDVTRASGACACAHCGRPYRAHPLDPYEVAWDGGLWLTVLCDGRRVKL